MSTPWLSSPSARPIIAAVLAGGLVAALALAGVLDGFERSEYDLLFRLRGSQAPAAPIVIAAIDPASLKSLGGWPLRRALHAQAIDRLREAGAAVIAIDLLFSGPAAWGAEDDQSRALGEAIARAGNIVLAAAITRASEDHYDKIDLNAPVPEIRAGAAAVAPVNLGLEPDGVARREALTLPFGDRRLPHFVVEVHRLAVRAGIRAAPLPSGDTILINFRGGPGSFVWLPYHRVVAGQFPREAVAGKIVLVGATDPMLQDVLSTPLAGGRAMPGIEVHANALETLVTGSRIRVLPRAAQVAFLLALSVAAGLMITWLRDRGLLLAGAAIVAVAAAGLGAFSTLGWWLRTGPILFGLAVASLTAVVADATDRRSPAPGRC